MQHGFVDVPGVDESVFTVTGISSTIPSYTWPTAGTTCASIPASGRDTSCGYRNRASELGHARRSGVQRARGGDDPLWYKDAIIYRRTSSRSSTATTTASAIFTGLTQKLDYLQGLGITCLWLLPFFPSPLRDDGYDIADY